MNCVLKIGALAVLAGVLTFSALAQPNKPTAFVVRMPEAVGNQYITYRLQPAHPKNVCITGSVVLKLLIAKSGAVKDLELLSGHRLLAEPAIEVVKQWRYEPYFLNDQPVEY